jgi:hypothetical protein
MRTIQHRIAGSETAGASTRFGPACNPRHGAEQAQVALAEPSSARASGAWPSPRSSPWVRG